MYIILIIFGVSYGWNQIGKNKTKNKETVLKVETVLKEGCFIFRILRWLVTKNNSLL